MFFGGNQKKYNHFAGKKTSSHLARSVCNVCFLLKKCVEFAVSFPNGPNQMILFEYFFI